MGAHPYGIEAEKDRTRAGSDRFGGGDSRTPREVQESRQFGDGACLSLHASVEHDLTGRAAQLSFYFLLAIFPLLIFISAMLGYVFASRPDLYASMLGYVGQVMPWQARELVGGTVSDIVVETTGGKLSAGLVLALWSGSSGIVAVIDGLDVALWSFLMDDRGGDEKSCRHNSDHLCRCARSDCDSANFRRERRWNDSWRGWFRAAA